MKKLFLLSTAAFVIGYGQPAFAQMGSSAKDSDNRMLDQTRYIDESGQRQAAAPTEDILIVEPAAGEDRSVSDFTGPYIGADIGYSWGLADINDPGGPDGEIDLDDFEGGIFAGYGYAGRARGNYSYYGGIEAGYEWSEADDTLGVINYEKNNHWLVTFRPGLVMENDMLGYGIIGYSRAEYESAGADEDFDGLVLGLGGEINTGMVPRVRLEYAYTDYAEETFNNNIDFEPQDHAIKLGVLMRF